MNTTASRVLSLAALSLVLVPGLAIAQALGGGDPLAAEATQAVQWVITLVRIVAVIFVIGAFLVLASGRAQIASLAVVVLGVIGAAKAEQITNFLMGA